MGSVRHLALIATVTFLMSCSGSSGPSAATLLDRAMAATTAAHGMHEEVTSTTPTASATQTSTASGVYSFDGGLGQFTVDTGAILGKLDVVATGPALFIKVPVALRGASKGRGWVSASLDNPPTIPGAGNVISLAGGADAARLFTAIKAHRTSVTKTAAGYTAKLDLTGDPLAKLVGGTADTVDVTVDASGRITQVVQRVALSGNATGTVTSVYSSFGASVNATTPPHGDVIDAAQLLGG